MRYEPHDYQRYVTGQIVSRPRLAVFMEMGLGKTSATLSAIDILMNERLEVRKVLVISPLKVARLTWEEEIGKWDELSHLRLSKAVGTEAQRIKALEADADIYAINRENCEWLLHYIKEKRGNRWPFQMMVIDESSSFKNRAAKRFKAVRAMAAATPRIVELSGTPAPNGLMDLWAQIYLLDRGQRLGRTITAYRDAYFLPDKRGAGIVYSYRPRRGAAEEIERRISDIAISMRASDWIDMPERADSYIRIPMAPQVAKAYAKMRDDYLVTLDEKEIVAASAGAVATKLLQMANGACYLGDDHPGEYAILHDLKIKALREILEAQGDRPMLVFYQFRHDLERLKEAFADLNPRELLADADKKDWDEGRIRLLLAHPASMGHGLNMQEGGSSICWFGLTFNLEQYEQANARLYRQGQRHPVSVIHLVTEGTMDEEAIRRLRMKKQTQDGLLDAVKAEIKGAKRRRSHADAQH